MTVEEAIKHSKNKKGMKYSFKGLCENSADLLDNITELEEIDYGAGYAFSLRELATNYNEARTAWLEGDLETVAEFFGLYV